MGLLELCLKKIQEQSETRQTNIGANNPNVEVISIGISTCSNFQP